MIDVLHDSLKEHYHRKPPGSRLSRILGLTASPIFNPKKPVKSLTELEANLDARIFEVSGQRHKVLNKAAPKPLEQLIEFESNIVVEPTSLENKFMEVFGARLDSKTKAKIDVTRIVRQNSCSAKLGLTDCHLSQRLGALGVAYYVSKLAKDLSAPQQLQHELSKILFSMSTNDFTVSPQVQALLDVLGSYQKKVNSAFHAIVFVQQRAHARILTEIVRKMGTLEGWLKADWLVGHGGRGGPEAEKDLGMEVKRVSRAGIMR
jgi:endoribonuclease Dicer